MRENNATEDHRRSHFADVRYGAGARKIDGFPSAGRTLLATAANGHAVPVWSAVYRYVCLRQRCVSDARAHQPAGGPYPRFGVDEARCRWLARGIPNDALVP